MAYPEPQPQALSDLLAASRAKSMELAAGDVVGVAVAEVTDDSREVKPDTLFAAVPGEKLDGRRFLSQALAAGASAALVGLREGESLAEQPGFAEWRDSGRPIFVTEHIRRDLALLAFDFHGRPDAKMKLVGVTGTNGKSTTTGLVRQIAQGTGLKAAELGTLGWRIGGGDYQDAGNTTPGPIKMARLFAEMIAEGVQLLAMEVSSHAIDQKRVWGLDFDVCAFTNLTQDHLDYHGTLEAYAEVKRGWFVQRRRERPDVGVVVNVDDEIGRAIAADNAQPEDWLWSYGFEKKHNPRLRADQIEARPDGARILLHSRGNAPRSLEFPLRGLFNVHNALAALGACVAAGIGEGEACRELSFCQPPPGRFQPVDAGQPFSILVDYAHTPDALERLLQNARALQQGFAKRREARDQGNARAGLGVPPKAPANDARLAIVFGCGGDRDRAKRPIMGGIAARLADAVLLTSDNPRSEKPEAILNEILAGVERRDDLDLQVIPDRREAIRRAIAAAHPGDVVLIAGKGHETYQEIDGEKFPFSDAEEARQAASDWLENRKKSV
jgi:UDP-N-acetylmuramoyl-L-alanyl-D-glutamate--2,6-diaminopimelate ligase